MSTQEERGQAGLSINRMFTSEEHDPLDLIQWNTVEARAFRTGDDQKDMVMVEAPENWSQGAINVVASKYLKRSESINAGMGETSIRGLINRVIDTIANQGLKQGYFDEETRKIFRDEMSHILVHQFGAFNSPVYFNCGLMEAYGMAGTNVSNFFWDPKLGKPVETTNYYGYPQLSACFIQSIKDDLQDIWEHVGREMKIFKGGSGCISGDANVYTSDDGFIPIEKLFQKYSIDKDIIQFDDTGCYVDVSDLDISTISFDRSTGKFMKDQISKVWSYDVPKDDKLTISLDNGASATVSAWHPFEVWDGKNIVERRADEIQRGDAVIGTNDTIREHIAIEKLPVVSYEYDHYSSIISNEVEIDSDLSWLIGYFIGDGSLGYSRCSTTNKYGTRYEYENLRLRFFDETRECLERAASIISEKFGNQTTILRSRREGKGYEICFRGCNVTSFFRSIFTPGEKTYTVAIPEFMMFLPYRETLSLLAGLLDSDGSVYNRRAIYSTASKKCADQISLISATIGTGGSVVKNGNTYNITVCRKSSWGNKRLDIGSFMSHPDRKKKLSEPIIKSQGRNTCMKIDRELLCNLIGFPKQKGDWFSVKVGEKKFHLGRVEYEGIINPAKLSEILDELPQNDEIERLKLIAESITFVSSVEQCDSDPDFYDLTVNSNSNYIAGSGGLVTIHNSGTNFSSLRSNGESLKSGGTSSGVLSFLEIFDKAAGSTKSGGTSRRAAKMVILDADHPEIMDFIQWKSKEEEKAKMLIAAGMDSDFNGEAYKTVSGQNSNNTVRLTDEFMETLMRGGMWDLKSVTTGEVLRTVKAEEIFQEICEAAWRCADPGLQFDSTINNWHTCLKSGKINASNPCSEYMFIDDSACNLASVNLNKFLLPNGDFDISTFKHVCRLFTIAQDIIIDYASYPTETICKNSHSFRPIGLGFSNLGSMLMRLAIPYDSDRGRAIASTITAIMTAAAYGMSAEMAEVVGPFAAFKQNKTPMLSVITKHARKATNPTYEKMCPEYLTESAAEMWDETVALGKKFGFRNSQATLVAPTGTISFMLDCDTTGIEPEFALVKEKLYAGGGRDRLVNLSVEPALVTLGYTPDQIRDIITHINGSGRIKKHGDSGISEKRLLSFGFNEEIITKVNDKIKSSRSLGEAFSNTPEAMTVVKDVQMRFNIDADDIDDPLLRIGFEQSDISEANTHIYGHMGIETAPHLRAEHLSIFDCACMCGIDGTRLIQPEGHVKMMAAIQPFLSGSISKTVNLPNDATTQDIWDIFVSSWQQGLKCVTIYRDGSKGSQPLTVSGRPGEEDGIEEDLISSVVRRKRPPKLMMTGGRRCVQLNGYTIYVHAYRDEDTGKINEIWIDTKPGGGILDGFLNSMARLVSTALQYGIPMEEIVKKFAYTSFDPCGNSSHPKIKQCRSIIDLVFRTIAIDFLGDDSYADGIYVEQTPIPQQPVVQQSVQQEPVSRHTEVIICSNCGSDQVQKTGTCYTCRSCGTTSGCA